MLNIVLSYFLKFSDYGNLIVKVRYYGDTEGGVSFVSTLETSMILATGLAGVSSFFIKVSACCSIMSV